MNNNKQKTTKTKDDNAVKSNTSVRYALLFERRFASHNAQTWVTKHIISMCVRELNGNQNRLDSERQYLLMKNYNHRAENMTEITDC